MKYLTWSTWTTSILSRKLYSSSAAAAAVVIVRSKVKKFVSHHHQRYICLASFGRGLAIQRPPLTCTSTYATINTTPSDCPDKNKDLQLRNMSSGAVGGSNDEGLLVATRSLIPNLTNALHKGQAGRIAVIGGSEDYTGAPYFAAISALKVGADLAHVFCVHAAGLVIKTYSPELIVHPILDSENAVEKILEWAPRFHSFVIGPGLGIADKAVLDTVTNLILKLKELEKPMVIDADGLTLVTQKPDLIRNYPKVILTPNSMELSRLFNAVLGGDNKPVPSVSTEKIRELAAALGNVTILSKGATDVASNGRLSICCAGGGSNRRCGGQGDLLAGALAVMFHWALMYGDRGGPAPPELLAAFGACKLTRECARLAYSQNGRSTTTTDLVRLIHQAFTFLFGN